jgi:hypothetical protein
MELGAESQRSTEIAYTIVPSESVAGAADAVSRKLTLSMSRLESTFTLMAIYAHKKKWTSIVRLNCDRAHQSVSWSNTYLSAILVGRTIRKYKFNTHDKIGATTVSVVKRTSRSDVAGKAKDKGGGRIGNRRTVTDFNLIAGVELTITGEINVVLSVGSGHPNLKPSGDIDTAISILKVDRDGIDGI